MAEETEYRDGSLAVTALAVEVGQRSWALANVARAYLRRSSTRAGGVSLVVVAFLLFACYVSGQREAVCLVPALVFLIWGAAMVAMGWDSHDVLLEMAGGKRVKAWSGPQRRAAAIAEAVNEAVAKRQLP